MFTNWRLSKTYRQKPLKVKEHGGGVSDRQSKIPGFCQETLSHKSIFCAGAGGLASHVGEGLARKGVGRLVICDDDAVEPSNLNRQKFYKCDLYKNKALCLGKNLSKESFMGTQITGISMNFQDTIQSALLPQIDTAVFLVDNNLAREIGAEWAMEKNIPAIFVAVSGDGDGAYVFKQLPGKACWGCAFPREKRIQDSMDSYHTPCPGVAAIKDVLMLVSGAAVYAIDTLFMERPISWNYREFHLAGFMPEAVTHIERRKDCHLCGSK